MIVGRGNSVDMFRYSRRLVAQGDSAEEVEGKCIDNIKQQHIALINRLILPTFHTHIPILLSCSE
jgi:hypothetical protein